MANKRISDVAIEDARIIFRNFSGAESMYNRAGAKNFCVILEDAKVVEAMRKDGWNIKQLRPQDEEDMPADYIQVAVSYANIPPTVYMITKKNKIRLTEKNISMLDSADIATADVILTPYLWEMNGKTGIKAYLKTMYVTINEDVFANKYDVTPAMGDEDIPF